MGRVQQQLVASLHRLPLDSELAEASGVPLEQVRAIRAAARTVTSLDAPVGAEQSKGATLGDFVSAEGLGLEEEVTVRLGNETLRRAVAALPERQRRVIELRYGLTPEGVVTLSAVAKRLGISVEDVRTNEHIALTRLAEERELQALL